MSLRWLAIRRIAFGVIAAYLVISLVFAFVALTPDPFTAVLEREAGIEASQEDIPVKETDAWERLVEYRQERNLDEPVLDRYFDWLTDITTLDWGQSHGTTRVAAGYGTGYAADVPVTTLVSQALSYTLWYLLPAIAVSVVSGIAIGLYAATHRNTLVDRLATSAAHFGFSLPNFWLAGMVSLFGLGGLLVGVAGLANDFLIQIFLAAAILSTSLFAGQLRYARAQSLEYIDAEFIKLVRAKGASNGQIARHLLRNAAVPLLSLFFADMLGIVVLNIFVIEYVFSIPGLGGLSLAAIQSRDLPVILGASMVIILFGVVGNFLQDIAHLMLDPRVESE